MLKGNYSAGRENFRKEKRFYTPPRVVERSVFCEMAFLEKISPLLEKPVSLIDYSPETAQIKSLLDVLISFDLYIDAPDDFILRLNSETCSANEINSSPANRLITKIAYKRRASNLSVKFGGKNKFKSIFQLTPNVSSTQLNAIYLTDAALADCQKITENYGVIVVRYDEKKQSVVPFQWLIEAPLDKVVEKQKHSDGWGCLQTLNAKSNSLILVDEYLFGKKKAMELNLREILDKILPTKSLLVPYYLTFMGNEKNEKNKAEISLSEAKEITSEIIRELRGENFKFKLNIGNLNGLEHDRWLITNAHYISVPAGFDLVSGKPEYKIYSKNTCIHGSCIYSNRADKKSYKALCQRISNMCNDDCVQWFDDNFNRLL